MDDVQGSYYNSLTGMPNRDFRPRRPHQKSKNGCNQCKNRRIKCDELKPRCTRCSKGDLLCKYPGNPSSGEPSPSGPPHGLQIAPGRGSSSPGGREASGSPNPRYHFGSYFPNHPPGQPVLSRAPCPVVSPPPGTVSEHSELWSHFNAHTSQTLSFEDEDLYTLQLGIPGLVKDCPALAATVLSLAATCSCVDIISHAAPIPGDRERVKELLGQANRHHLHSLQTMQRVIAAGGPAPHEEYDHILANAWLMAAYGTASHRLRIWLHRTQQPGQPLEEQFLPDQSGWITMFQTVHAVYTSLLRHSNQGLDTNAESRLEASSILEFGSCRRVATEPEWTPAKPPDNPVPFSEEIILPAGYPMHISCHFMFPFLVSTSDEALQALQQHARNVSLIVSNVSTPATEMSTIQTHQEGLASSLLAIDILSDIATQVRNTSSTVNNTYPSTQTMSEEAQDTWPRSHFGSGPSPGQFGEVSPWLRRYLSRALAVTPSSSLRRLLMAFLYRVPRPFLDTVKRLLDSLPLAAVDSASTATGFKPEQASVSTLVPRHHDRNIDIDPALTETGFSYNLDTNTTEVATTSSQNSSGEKVMYTQPHEASAPAGSQDDTEIEEMLDALAMDVFAHWLAFTLLLDGVWFIGDVGGWELGRIVGMVRSGRLKMDSQSMEDSLGTQWWPGRIYDYAEGLKTGEALETF